LSRHQVIRMGPKFSSKKEYERLTGMGVKFSKVPTKVDWGTEAIFDDTCGNFIQIYQK
jgi:hypothetical protein